MASKFWKLGIIGWPLGYSLSPMMHAAALKAAGLQGEYREYKIRNNADLDDWLDKEAPKLDGFNVTMPYKEDIFRWLQFYGTFGRPDVVSMQAVNTVKIDGNRPTGWDTDGDGFLQPLAAVVALKGRRVLLLGAGGAAKGIAIALAQAGVRTLKIWNRHSARAEQLAELVEDLHNGCDIHLLTELSDPESGAVDLVVNATPMGMAGKEEVPTEVLGHVHQGQVVYDIVYEPRETRLVRTARERGCAVITGDRMLAAQGAAAFEIWTGVPAAKVLPAMKKALDEHFAARG